MGLDGFAFDNLLAGLLGVVRTRNTFLGLALGGQYVSTLCRWYMVATSPWHISGRRFASSKNIELASSGLVLGLLSFRVSLRAPCTSRLTMVAIVAGARNAAPTDEDFEGAVERCPAAGFRLQ